MQHTKLHTPSHMHLTRKAQTRVHARASIINETLACMRTIKAFETIEVHRTKGSFSVYVCFTSYEKCVYVWMYNMLPGVFCTRKHIGREMTQCASCVALYGDRLGLIRRVSIAAPNIALSPCVFVCVTRAMRRCQEQGSNNGLDRRNETSSRGRATRQQTFE